MMKHDCWTRHLRELSNSQLPRAAAAAAAAAAAWTGDSFVGGFFWGISRSSSLSYGFDGEDVFFFKWVLFMDIFIWRFINNGIFTVFNVGMMGIMVNINGECPIVDDDHACFQWDIDHFYSPSNGLNGREPVGTMFF